MVGKDIAVWDYVNTVLLKMCGEHPEHKDASIVLGKIILIGRSYAASLQRTNKSEHSSDEFFTEDLWPKIKEISDELDRRILKIKEMDINEDSTLVEALRLHGLLTYAIREATGQFNTSFASKYLHFHAPNVFYIYDSIAKDRISEFMEDESLSDYYAKGKAKLENELGGARYIIPYLDYCAKIRACKQLDEFNGLSPREIDAKLLGYSVGEKVLELSR